MRGVCLVAALLLGSAAHAADKHATGPVRPKFTSAKTPLSSCKKSHDQERGPVLHCPAPKGFLVEVYAHPQTKIIRVTPSTGDGSKRIEIEVHEPGKQLEWRLADKQPYAVIVRDQSKDADKLVVRGLPGFERIVTEVDVKANKNAAAHAAALADAMY